MLAMPATTRPCHRVRFAAAVLLAATTTGLTVPGVAVTPLNVRLAAASRNDLVDRLQAVELPAVAHNSILLGLAAVFWDPAMSRFVTSLRRRLTCRTSPPPRPWTRTVAVPSC